MSRQATIAEHDQFERLANIENENPFLYIHRPIIVYERRDGYVVESERREHLDLLIDKRTRTRVLLHRCANVQARDKWHTMAGEAKRVDWPITCYAKQLPMILDYQHKVIGIFGGNRSGKTHGGLQWFCDKIVSRGGKRSEFWFVSYEQRATTIGVQKMVLGQNTGGRMSEPIIPPELVISWPKSHLATDQAIHLADGSRIVMKYASKQGENLMGYSPVAVIVDEGARVRNATNHTVLIARVLDAKGQIAYATTPAAGHWLEEKVHEPGLDYPQAAIKEAEGKKVDIISTSFTMWDNPWQDPEEIETTIRAMGDKDSNVVRREAYGEWVKDGKNLWTDFDETRNTFQGHGRDAEDYGMVCINRVALGSHFRRFDGSWRYVGGMDFNFDPMSVLIAQVECPSDCDQSDRSNWSLRILDEAVRRAENIYSFASWLNRAGIHRGQADDIFARMPIICDASGAYINPPENHKIPAGSSLASTMRDYGFGCEPCNYSKKNRKPKNPGIMDSVSLCHLKFKEGKILIHAERCRKLIYSLHHQLRDEHGMPEKVSNTISDKLSGPIDAMRYLVWSIWGVAPPVRIR